MIRVLAGALALLAAWPARAQEAPQEPFLEEQRRRGMDVEAPPEGDVGQRVLWDAGAWLHLELVTLGDEPEKRQRTLRYADLRVWGRLTIDRTYTAYARVLADYVDFNSGDQFEGEDDDEFRPGYVDQAWLEADWSTPGTELRASAGRKFLSLGRGLLFNQVAYGAQGFWSSGPWTARAFLAHSILHDDDLDTSMPDADDSRRAFAAAEAEYALSGDHRVYVVGLIQRDRNDEDPEIAAQDWRYDSNYLGVGGRGTLSSELGYQGELIYEFGRSVAAGSTDSERISAFALTASVEWSIEAAAEPKLVLEYLFGSGDADRASVTEQSSGNAPGSTDKGFLAFGWIQTGFALFPRLSNLHILRVGGSMNPLHSVDAFRHFDVGLYGFLYRKHRAAAPISDPRSFNDDADVGREIDLLVRWRILSDVGFSLNYGIFFPGDAYDEDDPRNFFSAGITYSF